MKVKKLSASRVGQYLKCPQEFYFDRHTDKEGVKINDNSKMHQGSIMHEVLEKLRYKPKKELVPKFINEVNENYKRYVLSPSEVNEIIELLENWIDTRDLGYEILDVETYFKIPIKNFHLTGIIDVVEKMNDNEIRVTDYKTGNSFKTMSDIRDNTQLKFYTLAAMEIYNVDNVEVSLDQVRHEPPEYIQYTKKDLVNFLEYMISLQRRMTKDKTHKPSPGWYCGWCDYHRHCPVMKQGVKELEVKEFTMEEMGEKYNEAHGMIKILKNKKSKLKKMIIGKMGKEEMKKYSGEDVKITKTRSQYTNYDPETVVKNIPEESYGDVLKVKKSALEKLDLDKEKRDNIGNSTSSYYSNPYIRVSSND